MTHKPNPTHTNALIDATSPYLLQHAHNPVDWKQSGDEAFNEARERDLPVLLSIGYATCYWCHVMERESFENEDTARVMNDNFVCIKLDREQHPEIDELYMAATTITTGSGGWPLNVFLDPKTRAPFQCTTYSPPKDMYGRPAFTTLLSALADAWNTRRDEVTEQCARIADAVREQLTPAHDPAPVGEHEISRAVTTLLQRADTTHGGFGAAPKFPQPALLELLLDTRAVLDQDTRHAVDRVVRTTLDAMGTGGLFDHVAGGFRRYCVDENWTVPHFEKMLYDNAQLLALYARAAATYDSPFYASIARRTASFLEREMTVDTDRGQLFISAIDAEVHGREGLADLWTPDELRAAISVQADADRAAALLGLNDAPNFQDPHHPDAPPAHVPRLSAVPSAENLALLVRVADELRAARDQRTLPTKDDKAIAAWNAMTAQAFLTAGRDLDDDALTTRGRAALDATTATFWTDATLKRSSRAGTTEIDAPLEDHAALLSALATRAQDDPDALDHAEKLFTQIETRFADAPGVYFDTDATRADLFARARTLHDGATPSPLGVLTHTLATLAATTTNDAWTARAADAMRGCSAQLAQSPAGSATATRALLTMLTHRATFEPAFDFAAQQAPAPSAASPITLFVSEDRVELTEDRPAATFRVALDIADPYHVVAAEPGDADAAKHMVPLRVGLVSGQGVAVYADYPEGEPFGSDRTGRININTGRLEFDIALELAPGVGASPGHPELGLTYQACNDTSCQAPRTVKLGVELVIPSDD